MKRPYQLFAILFLLSSLSFSQSGTAKSLEIGNIFVYEKRPEWDLDNPTYHYDIVIGDTLINGIRYSKIGKENGCSFQRADSAKIYLFRENDGSEYVIFDFNIDFSSDIYPDPNRGHYDYHTDSTYYTFGANRRVISHFYWSHFGTIPDGYEIWTYGLGQTYYSESSHGSPSVAKQLVACRINGVDYGDITYLDVEEENLIVANNFNLSQNYPNPFNPNTQITYELPHDSNVELVIYNTLGEEVNKLVSGNQAIGRYTINWNGQNSLGEQVPGGVYFYALRTKDFTKTRKMLLLR